MAASYPLCSKMGARGRVVSALDNSTAKQKVAGSNPTRASGWKIPSVHPAVKWVPDLIQGRKGSGRRGMGSANLYQFAARAAPTANRLSKMAPVCVFIDRPTMMLDRLRKTFAGTKSVLVVG